MRLKWRRPAAAGKTRGRWRAVAAWVATAVAGLLVLFALVAPNQIGQLEPGAFVRIPAEALVGVAVLLVLPARARRVVAALVGVLLGLLTIVKVADMGFYSVLARPFDLVLDWTLFADGVNYLTGSLGRAGAIASVVGVVVLALALVAAMTLSVLRLTRLAARRKTATTRGALALGAIWIACAILGAQIVPGAPVASGSAADLVHDRALDVRTGLRDHQEFAEEAAVDAFRGAQGKDLLNALRGKDVIFAFIESYGRTVLEDPQYAGQVGAALDAGNRRLRAAGFESRSAFLTSPMVGGGSWLAHATLLSGLWITNEQRHRSLTSGDRLTIGSAFRRTGDWRTVAVMPGTSGEWPEQEFFGYDQLYRADNQGYRGPKFALGTMPDQYALASFERLEHGKRDRQPLMAEIALTSSHAPWTPIPRLIGWDDVGDGSVYGQGASEAGPRDGAGSDLSRTREAYGQTIAYSVNTLISYLEKYGNDDTVLIFLGDHQPVPVLTGEDAGRDVPITIVTRDGAVLDRISGWGWDDGVKPDPQAPVWRMDAFRDRFLTAFSGDAQPARLATR